MQIKVCIKCGEEKDITEFHKQKSGTYGVNSYCKFCRKSLSKQEKLKRLALVPVGHKFCLKCNQDKLFSEFSNDKSKKTGLFSWCKICVNKDKKEKYLERKEKILKYQKSYYIKNNEKILKRCSDYYDKFPWMKTFLDIQQRCTNPNNPKYEIYKYRLGDITREDLKELWFRDQAYEMEQATIDRIDNDLPYTFSNCQYIELEEHNRKSQLEQRLRKSLIGK